VRKREREIVNIRGKQSKRKLERKKERKGEGKSDKI